MEYSKEDLMEAKRQILGVRLIRFLVLLIIAVFPR